MVVAMVVAASMAVRVRIGMLVAVVVLSAVMVVWMIMGMIMAMVVGMTVAMTVTMAVVMVVVVMPRGVAPGFRGEGARHRLGKARKRPHHLDQLRILQHVQSLCGRLDGDVPLAEMPGDAHQPHRISADLQKLLRRRHDAHQLAVGQRQGIAIGETGALLELDAQFRSRCRGGVDVVGGALRMVERNRVDDALLLHGRAAEDSGGVQDHDAVPIPSWAGSVVPRSM